MISPSLVSIGCLHFMLWLIGYPKSTESACRYSTNLYSIRYLCTDLNIMEVNPKNYDFGPLYLKHRIKPSKSVLDGVRSGQTV